MEEKPENINSSTPEEENGEEKAKSSPTPIAQIFKRVLPLSIRTGAVLLCLFGGWWFFEKHFARKDNLIKSDATQDLLLESTYFMSLPELTVNLRSNKSRGTILRAMFVLQLYQRDEELKIKEKLPLIMDQLLSYLRDQSVASLEGPGLERMRQALLTRINNIIHPLRVHRVVLKDFVIQ